MDKKQQAYKKIEKWWLGLIVLFFVLYNLPGVPAYHDQKAMLIHGALTIIPLWLVAYGGMIILHKQRRLRQNADSDTTVGRDKEEVKC